MSRIARRLGLAVASTALALALAELSLALVRPVEFMRPRDTDGTRAPGAPDENGAPGAGGAWRTYLHRASDVPGLAYELAPEREGSHRGATVRTNSHGMRDDEPAPRGANVRRIAVVGDSTTFGFAVEARETYADVLEELLNADVTDGRRFETLNFGVGGYSTRDEVLVVEHKALAFDPELIVIGYSLNDADPRPIQPLHQHFVRPEWWQHSNLLRLAARWSHAGELQPDGGKGYTQSIYAADSPTWASVVDGFARIAELSRPRDIPVLVVIFPRLNELGEPPYPLRAIHAQVSQAARAAGLLVLDLERAYARLPVESLRNPRDAMHPSVLGHRLAAEAIRARVGPRLERLGATSRDDANAEH